MSGRPKRQRLQRNDQQSTPTDVKQAVAKVEVLDAGQDVTTASMQLDDVMSTEADDQLQTNNNETVGAYEIFKSCRSSTELLALPDYYTIIRTIFEQHPREKLKCPNEMCLRKFTNTQSLISHAQQCAVAKARSTQIDKSTASSRSHRKREPPKRYEHYKEYKGCASSWAVLSSVEKLALIKDALERSATKRIACLNPECLLKLRDANEVLEHVNQCYLPEYFHYLGKAEEFRSLEKKEQSRIMRKAMGVVDCLPCLNIDVLNCGQTYSHCYGLIYHMERCGVSDVDRPWKCYRCGHTSTFLKSKDHLIECHRLELSELVERAQQLADSNVRDKSAKQRRMITDDNDRDGEEAQSAIRQEKADNLLRSLMKSARIRGQKASVSQGLLPEHSSRTSISAGVKRYKFKTVELGMPVPTENDLRNYQLALNYAAEAFDKARNAEPLCQSLRQIEFRRENWTTVSPEEYAKSELMNRLLEKRSVPVRMPRAAETQADDQRHSSSLQANGVAMKRGTNATAERLTVFEPRSLPYAIPTRRSLASEPSTSSNTYAGDGCVVYCGGPISVIASCPRLLEDGSECAAVSVFPDEEYLIDRNAANNISYLQLWRYERNSDSVSARLWFLLETNTGSVLTAVWCPILRGKVNRNKVKTEHCDRKANFVGVIAVGGLEGGVVIYGIPNEVSDLAQATEGICIMRSKPDLVLHLSDEYPDSPVISLAWSEFDGAARLAAVFASGHVGVWNMNNPLGAAKVIFDDRWVSPPVHIAFSEPNQLAISFREKCVRIYDSNQFECIIEETVPRSAGIKVASCERLFSGTFSYQGDCITTTEFLEHTMCYITLAPKEKNFFVVPLAFRHEVRLWDAAICPHSGCLYTVGADGRLEVSLNGHIVPRHAQIDFPFNSCRVAMTLVRKAKADHINKEGAVVGTDSLVKNEIGSGGDGEEAQSLRRIGTDLDSCAEQFTLEFSFDNIKHGKTPMDQISLDIRVESLNRVAVSQSVGRLVICGGEAGLLIFLPCQL